LVQLAIYCTLKPVHGEANQQFSLEISRLAVNQTSHYSLTPGFCKLFYFVNDRTSKNLFKPPDFAKKTNFFQKFGNNFPFFVTIFLFSSPFTNRTAKIEFSAI
jgi:hypothetical protein